MVKIPVLNHRFLISGTQLARTWRLHGSVQTVSWKIIISVAVARYSEIIILFVDSCKKSSISKKNNYFMTVLEYYNTWITSYSFASKNISPYYDPYTWMVPPITTHSRGMNSGTKMAYHIYCLLFVVKNFHIFADWFVTAKAFWWIFAWEYYKSL